jgi:methionine synthase I (cobalamin-dependent)
MGEVIGVNTSRRNDIQLDDFGNNITLRELIDRYNQSPEIAKKSQIVKNRVKPFQKLILGFFGPNTRITSLNRDAVKSYYSILEQLPRNIQHIYPEINKTVICKSIKRDTNIPKVQLG